MRDVMAAASDTRTEKLRRSELFAGLEDDALERVSATASELDVPAGTVLINPDFPASGVFVIVDGTAVAETHDGRDHELGPGECFGELAVLADTPRTGRVSAQTDIRCLAFERAAFERLLEREPAVARALLRVLAQRLVAAQRRP